MVRSDYGANIPPGKTVTMTPLAVTSAIDQDGAIDIMGEVPTIR